MNLVDRADFAVGDLSMVANILLTLQFSAVAFLLLHRLSTMDEVLLDALRTRRDRDMIISVEGELTRFLSLIRDATYS